MCLDVWINWNRPLTRSESSYLKTVRYINKNPIKEPVIEMRIGVTKKTKSLFHLHYWSEIWKILPIQLGW